MDNEGYGMSKRLMIVTGMYSYLDSENLRGRDTTATIPELIRYSA